MKIKSVISLLPFLVLIFSLGYSQEPCKVLKSEIATTYVGKCKKGLAHGKGVATGQDKYEGEFKNGLPFGKGKYTWANGDVYEGNWREGKKEGDGKLTYKKNGVDSTKLGIWKNDVFFKKKLPSPYKIIRSSSVARYSVQKTSNGNRVFFSFYQNGAINTTVSSLFLSTSSGTTYNLGSRQGFDNVVFPFKCKITYTTTNSLKTFTYNCEFEIEIIEPGNWEIVLNN